MSPEFSHEVDPTLSVEDLLVLSERVAEHFGGYDYRTGLSDSTEGVYLMREAGSDSYIRIEFSADRVDHVAGTPVEYVEYELEAEFGDAITIDELPPGMLIKAKQRFAEKQYQYETDKLKFLRILHADFELDPVDGFSFLTAVIYQIDGFEFAIDTEDTTENYGEDEEVPEDVQELINDKDESGDEDSESKDRHPILVEVEDTFQEEDLRRAYRLLELLVSKGEVPDADEQQSA